MVMKEIQKRTQLLQQQVGTLVKVSKENHKSLQKAALEKKFINFESKTKTMEE